MTSILKDGNVKLTTFESSITFKTSLFGIETNLTLIRPTWSIELIK